MSFKSKFLIYGGLAAGNHCHTFYVWGLFCRLIILFFQVSTINNFHIDVILNEVSNYTPFAIVTN